MTIKATSKCRGKDSEMQPILWRDSMSSQLKPQSSSMRRGGRAAHHEVDTSAHASNCPLLVAAAVESMLKGRGSVHWKTLTQC
eukprot:2186536-Amphidinium_carterae.1